LLKNEDNTVSIERERKVSSPVKYVAWHTEMRMTFKRTLEAFPCMVIFLSFDEESWNMFVNNDSAQNLKNFSPQRLENLKIFSAEPNHFYVERT
jgi:hypothetical protein